MIIRIRYAHEGGHFHCRVFTSPASILTFAKCGDVVFDEREWEEVKQILGRDPRVQFLEDGEEAPR